MDHELDELRTAIDAVDDDLIRLLGRRRDLTRAVGVLKRERGLPLVVPEREARLFADRRERARNAGVSPDLVEDLLRRTIRDSYASQEDAFATTGDPDRPVVVVGGAGRLGSCLASFFLRSGYEVRVLEVDDWPRAEDLCGDAGLVLVSVPIAETVGVIERLPELAADCVLADVTSIKREPVRAMLERHRGPVVGLHPMFGPDVTSLAKQVVVVCPGRAPDGVRWLLDQFAVWGASLREEPAAGHDRAMATIQAMRHFTTMVYGGFLARADVDLDDLLRLSSPIYRLELAMVGRLFAQDPQLYADIVLSAEAFPSQADEYARVFEELLTLVRADDRDGLVARFEATATHFGQHAARLFDEAGDLLRKAHDGRDLAADDEGPARFSPGP